MAIHKVYIPEKHIKEIEPLILKNIDGFVMYEAEHCFKGQYEKMIIVEMIAFTSEEDMKIRFCILIDIKNKLFELKEEVVLFVLDNELLKYYNKENK